MGTISTVTLQDSNATNVVFEPADNNEATQTATLRAPHPDGIRLGDTLLQTGTRRTSGTNRYKSHAKVIAPQLVTELNGTTTVSKIARTAYGEASFAFDASSTTEERANVVALLSSALAQAAGVAFVTQTVVDLEAPRG